jgi:putative ABC transport system permease protein
LRFTTNENEPQFMNLPQRIQSRIRALFRKRKLDAEMDEEMRSHIEMRTQSNIRAGMKPEEARLAALRRFGRRDSIREECQDQRGVRWIENFFRDVRFGVRQLRKNAGFTTVALLTLALGIGANTAIFSFVNAILLRPLPFKDPERLVMVFEAFQERGSHKDAVGAPVLGQWRQLSRSFDGLAGRGFGDFILTGMGQPETLSGAIVSANTFSLLGVKPLLGRDFLPEEETFGKHYAAILSYELWNRRFGGDSNIVGQTITVNSQACQVVGIMPPHTFFPDGNAQIWMPLAFSPDRLSQRHAHSYLVYGRLKSGVSLAQARADMDQVAGSIAKADTQNKGWGAEVYPLQEIMMGNSRTILLVLLGSVGLVLLIACANIANLLLARAAARTREFAIRMALGAGRGQIIRQLLVESLALATVGGIIGFALGQAGLRMLVHFSPPNLPRLWEGVPLDGMTLLFTLCITIVTGLVFGLAPALQTAKCTATTELSDRSRGSGGGHRRRRLRAALVISEMAVSLILLIGAGLMIRSFDRLLSQPLGFVPEHVVSMNFNLPDKSYPGRDERVRFFDQLLARASALPGVDSSALVAGLPLSGQDVNLVVNIPGAPPPASGEAASAGYSQVSPGYFHALKIPLLQGRDFSESDRPESSPVVVVDETFVKNFKLGSNAVGRRIGIGDGTPSAEIIGIVRDVKRLDLVQNAQGEMYRPYRQNCFGVMNLVLRTRRDPAEVTRAIRAEVDTLDRDLSFDRPRTMTELVASSAAERKLSAQLLGGFAGVALLLAAVGLYGVIAFNVAQRRSEIGIRMALGAQRADILRLVLRQGMSLALAGMCIGLVGALALARLLGSLLFEIQPNDPATFSVVPLVLATTTLLACFIPARRAMKTEPITALRHE